jgi:protoporphyrinogen oxidase
MSAFTTLTSRVVCLPVNDVDTDQIIPARFLKTTDKAGLGASLFADWRYHEGGSPIPGFVLNRPESQGAQILLAGDNFGCGSSREHAPWALAGFGFRAVISTAPLPATVALVGGAPPRVVEAARALRAATVTYVNVAARDVGGPPWHWLYLPEPALRPYRVGSASAAVPSLAPPGFRSFYVEMSGRAPVPEAEAVPAAVEALRALGLVSSPSDVRFAEVRVLPDAYVIHDHAYGAARDEVRDWLAGRDVLVAGRAGSWEYSSMEDALLSGREAARRLRW